MIGHGFKVDKLHTGRHAGSKAFRRLMELRKPALIVSGHIHEGEELIL